MPTFLQKENQFRIKVLEQDKKVTSKRVHIECITGLAKTYKILSSPLNATETKLESKICFVCFVLCNSRSSIVSLNAWYGHMHWGMYIQRWNWFASMSLLNSSAAISVKLWCLYYNQEPSTRCGRFFATVVHYCLYIIQWLCLARLSLAQEPNGKHPSLPP